MQQTLTRRSLLKSVSAVPLLTVIPGSALGLNGATPASDRITLATIGHGNRCREVTPFFLSHPDVQLIAVADPREQRCAMGKAQVDQYYRNSDCVTYRDFRELLARTDLDAVYIATGDRWHALASILAAKAGKDVYSEKPMTMTIEEGRELVRTMERLGTVYQCGHQRRSVDSYRFQVEIARSGLIGHVHTVEMQMWENPVLRPEAPQPVPAGLDYDMWLGPTPWYPYIPARFNGWNYFWDTGGGTLIAMGCHYTDIAQWGLDTDDTGPVHYEGLAEFIPGNFADTPVRCRVDCTYADGRRLVMWVRGQFAQRYIRFIGDEGWIQVDDDTNVVTAEPQSLLKRRAVAAKSWADPGGHIGDFLRCIKTRRETICSPEKSHRATTIGHIANLCLRLGRELTWDPKMEAFLNDAEADRMRRRLMRAPWHY